MGRRSRRRGEGPLSTRGVAGEVVGRRRAPVAVRTGGTGGRGERCGELGRLVEVGRGPWGGGTVAIWPVGLVEGGLFLFFVFLFFFSSSFCIFFLPQLTLQNYATSQNNLKELKCTASKRLGGFWNSCQFYKLKRHLIYCLGHCFK